MNIVALQTARAGSKSIPNKNLYVVRGQPLFMYNIMYAKKAVYVNDVYISTDSDDIKKIVNSDFKIINRPGCLCKDDSSHYDTILHGLKYIEEDQNQKVNILVILLGNSMGANSSDLDSAINILKNDSKLDSVCSVGKFNMFNAYRAFKIVDGKLDTVVHNGYIKHLHSKKPNKNDKDAFGDVYFFNGSFWVCKREAIIKNNGKLPFTWLGQNVCPFIQDSIYQEIDDCWQLKLIE